MPPYRFSLRMMHKQREIERNWEQTRSIMAMQHNTAMGRKRNIQARHIVPLSFDRIHEYPGWTREEALELEEKWPLLKSKN